MEKIQKIGEIALNKNEDIDNIIYRTPFIKLEEINAGENTDRQYYAIYKVINPKKFMKKDKDNQER